MIPKILHTIWIGNHKPRIDFRNKWTVFDDTWKIIHWDDKKLENFALHHIEGPTLKSDYVRLLILQKFGGIYADTDMMFFKPLDKFLNAKAFFTYQFPYIEKPLEFTPKGLSLEKCIKKDKINIFKFYNKDTYLNNNLIGSEPNSKVINTFIDIFRENMKLPVEQRFSYYDYGAGPSMTTYVANKFVDVNGYTQHCDDLSVWESKIFHPTNYIQYQKQIRARNFNMINEQIEIAKKLRSYSVHFQTANEVETYANS